MARYMCLAKNCWRLRICLVSIFWVLLFPVYAQVDTAWVRRFVGPDNGNDQFLAVGTDSRGAVYAAGYATSPTTGADILIVKYLPDGTPTWVQRYDGPANGNDYAIGIAVDNQSNVYVTGYVATSLSGNDYCTIKYDSLGNLQWVRTYNGPGNGSDIPADIALDNQNNVYVTGYSTGSGTGDDFCTIKYTTNGTQQWVNRYNGPANSTDRANAIAVDIQGNIYVTGQSIASNYDYLTIKYNTNGAQQWTARYNGDGNGVDNPLALAVDRLGNCYITGYSWGSGTADYDYLTIKYTTAGTREWVARYNGDGNDNDLAYSLTVDEMGYVCVTGYSTGLTTNNDVATLRYDQNGNLLWVRRYDLEQRQEYGRWITADNRGNVYLTGYTSSATSGHNWLTISYDRLGNRRFVVSYNDIGNGNDMATALTLDSTANIIVAGYGYGGATANDAVVIKYIQPDVAAERILSPLARMDTATAILPRAVIANRGSAPTDIKVSFIISRPNRTRVYTDSAVVPGVGVGETAVVTFAQWQKPYLVGPYIASCSTWRAYDQNPANDVVELPFQITAGPYGWEEMNSVPPSPSGRMIKAGGALAYHEPLNRIYCIKGNRSSDFYYYQPNQLSWVILPLIPNGPSGKTPGKGACVATDNEQFVYIVRGNNTLEFWRFAIDSGTYAQLPNVPSGPAGKNIKGGAKMVYVPEHNSLYLLKGYRNEFYRYRIETGEWQQMPDAPTPDKPKWENGSFIVYDGNTSIYGLKAKYNELWRFDLTTMTWDTLHRLRPLPIISRTGKTKKLKDGGCGAYYSDAIFAIKGGGTCEFWRYDVAGDSWVEIEPIPTYGSSGKKKTVKSGADMVFGGDALYAIKGGSCLEFWRYAIPPEQTSPRPQVAKTFWSEPGLFIRPNPTTGNRVKISCPRFRNGTAFLSVFDPTGRMRLATATEFRDGTAFLNLAGLNPGVYLLRVKQNRTEAFARLVLNH